jgi:hypothetical protein
MPAQMNMLAPKSKLVVRRHLETKSFMSWRCFLDDLEAAPPSRTELHQSCTELHMPETTLMIGCPQLHGGVQ